MCAAGTLTLQVEMQKVGSATMGLIQEENKIKPKKPISVSNANTVTKAFCFSRPHALKETTKKKVLSFFRVSSLFTGQDGLGLS